MIFLCYPKCSTCMKAKKWIDERKLSYEFRDIKENRPTEEELRVWWGKCEKPLKALFNTSGNVYKEMGLKDKLPHMSQEEQFRLLASDGMLVKRPLLICEEKVLVGFREKEWEESLKNTDIPGGTDI